MFRIALAVAPLVFAVSLAAPALAQQKEPPTCSAISFRPIEDPLTDSPQTAGHYRSRFGTIDVVGAQESGKPNYRVQVNRKALTPLSGSIPQSAFACLNSKNVKTPPQPVGGPCDGSRFRVAVDNSGKNKLVMLFALKGNDWKLCEAGTPQS